MHKLIQLRTADDMADKLAANFRAQSKELHEIASEHWPSPVAKILKTRGVPKPYALVEVRNFGCDSIRAMLVAGALLEFWPVVVVGNDLRGDQFGTYDTLKLTECAATLIFARSEPLVVSESVFATRKLDKLGEATYPSNWEIEMRLTDMTKARVALEKLSRVEIVRCEIREAAQTLMAVLKNGL